MYCLKEYGYEIETDSKMNKIYKRVLKTVANLLTFQEAKRLRKEKYSKVKLRKSRYKEVEIFPIDRIRE